MAEGGKNPTPRALFKGLFVIRARFSLQAFSMMDKAGSTFFPHDLQPGRLKYDHVDAVEGGVLLLTDTDLRLTRGL